MSIDSARKPRRSISTPTAPCRPGHDARKNGAVTSRRVRPLPPSVRLRFTSLRHLHTLTATLTDNNAAVTRCSYLAVVTDETGATVSAAAPNRVRHRWNTRGRFQHLARPSGFPRRIRRSLTLNSATPGAFDGATRAGRHDQQRCGARSRRRPRAYSASPTCLSTKRACLQLDLFLDREAPGPQIAWRRSQAKARCELPVADA